MPGADNSAISTHTPTFTPTASRDALPTPVPTKKPTKPPTKHVRANPYSNGHACIYADRTKHTRIDANYRNTIIFHRLPVPYQSITIACTPFTAY